MKRKMATRNTQNFTKDSRAQNHHLAQEQHLIRYAALLSEPEYLTFRGKTLPEMINFQFGVYMREHRSFHKARPLPP
jgi:hypothetical protein